jgi:hypothetical protein
MRNGSILFAFMIQLILSSTHAATARSTEKCHPGIAQTHSVGFVCKTSKNKTFKLVQKKSESWMDLDSGIIWSPALVDRYDRDKAKTACRKIKMELPSRQDFRLGEKHGFREVLPDMRDRFFWTSTAHSKSPNARLLFNGNFGTLFWVAYNNVPYESVRCIMRKSQSH